MTCCLCYLQEEGDEECPFCFDDEDDEYKGFMRVLFVPRSSKKPLSYLPVNHEWNRRVTSIAEVLECDQPAMKVLHKDKCKWVAAYYNPHAQKVNRRARVRGDAIVTVMSMASGEEKSLPRTQNPMLILHDH